MQSTLASVGCQKRAAANARPAVDRTGAREEPKRSFGEIDVHEGEDDDRRDYHSLMSLPERELIVSILAFAVEVQPFPEDAARRNRKQRDRRHHCGLRVERRIKRGPGGQFAVNGKRRVTSRIACLVGEAEERLDALGPVERKEGHPEQQRQ